MVHPVQFYRKLIEVARANPPADSVPYAFESRVLARLRAASPADHLELWARALWRAAFACLALVVLLGGLTLVAPRPSRSADLSQQLETTLLAAVDQESDSPP